ncbi:hypothetical protein K402DRAFT_130182 [Aulographum hederae CBS 113979]|uniref:Uncharacterized protein n=1 Tax=Aulographum hederae CBS 113979 TaxID=1176131 RepID=A0A6G1HF21_9PEZI|nr:hypothetical protein K402DRAFT_130182 [Aulographum hederae CBS 113979]
MSHVRFYYRKVPRLVTATSDRYVLEMDGVHCLFSVDSRLADGPVSGVRVLYWILLHRWLLSNSLYISLSVPGGLLPFSLLLEIVYIWSTVLMAAGKIVHEVNSSNRQAEPCRL